MFFTKRTARRSGLAAAILLGLAGPAAVAQADSIPPQYLQADQQSCIAACSGRNLLSPEGCTSYCNCEVKSIGEQFTLDEYTAMTQAVSLRQSPPKPLLDKMSAVTKTCKAGLK